MKIKRKQSEKIQIRMETDFQASDCHNPFKTIRDQEGRSKKSL